jgi:hypothetical protein
MPPEMNLPEDLRETERMLAAVRPSRAGNRDRLLFDAGGAAALRTATRRQRAWQGGCAALALACAALIAFPRVRVEERIVKAPEPPPPATLAEKPARTALTPIPATLQVPPDKPLASFLEMRNAVLRFGVGALPEKQGGGGSMPALQAGDGLDFLPAWQKRAALSTGERS